MIEIIFKHQVSEDPKKIPEERTKELDNLREYSEKISAALETSLKNIDHIEWTYLNKAREAMQTWRSAQQRQAEAIKNDLIAQGHSLDQSFIETLARHLSFEICNEKTFSPEKQLQFALRQIPNIPSMTHYNLIPILQANEKTKQRLLAPFQERHTQIENESALVEDLYQKSWALCSATKNFILEENPNNQDYQKLADRFTDIASNQV